MTVSKRQFVSTLFLFMLIASTAFGQYAKRQDAIWARTTDGAAITLDGIMNEAVWAKAESLVIRYGENAGLPTSGWRSEFQPDAITDPTNAVAKFLIIGNKLYLGFNIPDSSVGGTKDWARWDAILMSIKDIGSTTRPAPADEFFYTYWLNGYVPDTATAWAGRPPRFLGTFGDYTGIGRTPEQIATWDAVTVVDGLSNSDLAKDKGWVTEMVVDLSVLGYDVTKPAGDIVELSFSIWDCDNLFGGDPSKISTARTHWQNPWGNANANNVGRVFSRPDVTVNTAVLPDILPEAIIPNGVNFTEPVIDGTIDEDVWKGAYKIDIAWNNPEVRNTYPGVGPFMSGQYQPELNGNPRPPILDSSYATISLFFKDHYLYLAADISDQIVQGTEVFDKVDGLGLIIGDRVAKNVEEVMEFKLLRCNYALDGTFSAYDYLPIMVDSSDTEFAAALKGASTINVNSDVDEGFNIEMKVDLTKLGYPADLGDKLLFLGIDLYDGDSFDDVLNNYGTRVWYFREHSGGPAAAWMVMDPNTLVVGVDDETGSAINPSSIELIGNYPNPFNPSTKVNFNIPETGNANITIYNTLGQIIKVVDLSNLSSGKNEYNFNASNLASGVYFYQIKLNGNSSKNYTSSIGKMLLLK
ncbi:MAG: T9SS type A sorting domain-containing protein [bacterium]